MSQQLHDADGLCHFPEDEGQNADNNLYSPKDAEDADIIHKTVKDKMMMPDADFLYGIKKGLDQLGESIKEYDGQHCKDTLCNT